MSGRQRWQAAERRRRRREVGDAKHGLPVGGFNQISVFNRTRLLATPPLLPLRANQHEDKRSLAFADEWRRRKLSLRGLNGSKIEQNDSKLHRPASDREPPLSHFMPLLPEILPAPVCDYKLWDDSVVLFFLNGTVQSYISRGGNSP